jgi:hypothetical protein
VRGERESGSVWEKKRREILRRDKYICQECGMHLIPDVMEMFPGLYQLGHKVDIACGGSNDPSNLVVMCCVCNQTKPLHETIEDYIEWVDRGYWVRDWLDREYEDTVFDTESEEFLMLKFISRITYLQRHYYRNEKTYAIMDDGNLAKMLKAGDEYKNWKMIRTEEFIMYHGDWITDGNNELMLGHPNLNKFKEWFARNMLGIEVKSAA